MNIMKKYIIRIVIFIIILLSLLVIGLFCFNNDNKIKIPKINIKYRLRISTKVDYMPTLKTYYVETFLFMDRYLDSEIIRRWADTTEEKSKIRSILSEQKKVFDKNYKVWSDIIKNNPDGLDKAWKKWKSKRTIEITDY